MDNYQCGLSLHIEAQCLQYCQWSHCYLFYSQNSTNLDNYFFFIWMKLTFSMTKKVNIHY